MLPIIIELNESLLNISSSSNSLSNGSNHNNSNNNNNGKYEPCSPSYAISSIFNNNSPNIINSSNLLNTSNNYQQQSSQSSFLSNESIISNTSSSNKSGAGMYYNSHSNGSQSYGDINDAIKSLPTTSSSNKIISSMSGVLLTPTAVNAPSFSLPNSSNTSSFLRVYFGSSTAVVSFLRILAFIILMWFFFKLILKI